MGRFLFCKVLTTMERRTALVGAVLSGRHFSAVDFSDCCFAYAVCRHSVFEEVDLRGAQFIGASLHGARFVRCDLTGVSFAGALVEGTRFVDCYGLSFGQTCALRKRHAWCSGDAQDVGSAPLANRRL